MFRIQITEIRTVEKEVGHRWVGKDVAPPDGYTPAHVAPTEERIERLDQLVDELDLRAVIAVINHLPHGA